MIVYVSNDRVTSIHPSHQYMKEEEEKKTQEAFYIN
jgi:hypothetical protein